MEWVFWGWGGHNLCHLATLAHTSKQYQGSHVECHVEVDPPLPRPLPHIQINVVPLLTAARFGHGEDVVLQECQKAVVRLASETVECFHVAALGGYSVLW